MIREWERIAYCDVRDVVQWDHEPVFDKQGNVIGKRNVMTVTPSRLLKPEQAAQVRSITTKAGGLRFKMHSKLEAMAQLARILGLTGQDIGPGATITNNTQVNVSTAADMPAMEVARRVAFILERAEHERQKQPPTIEGTIKPADGDEKE